MSECPTCGRRKLQEFRLERGASLVIRLGIARVASVMLKSVGKDYALVSVDLDEVSVHEDGP